MTISELKVRPEFVTLAPQQKIFVEAYCTNGSDKVAAAKTAYTTKDDNSALAIANRNLRHPAIKKLTGDFYGMRDETGSKDEFLAILWRRVQTSTDEKMQLGWANLYMKAKGYEVKAVDKSPSMDGDSPDDIIDRL